MTTHFIDQPTNERAVCGAKIDTRNCATHPGDVTCFACRNSTAFAKAQPLVTGYPGPTEPVRLSGIFTSPPTRELDSWKNERGMFVVEEVLHHGEYRRERRVEVHAITPATVDGILMSSPYCYGSTVKAELVTELILDLRRGRSHRGIGWSTFRIITTHEPF